MRIGKKAPEISVQVEQLKDRHTRAAMEIIDARVGKKNDGTITPDDLKTTQEWINVTADGFGNPFEGLSTFERDLVREKLPVLSTELIQHLPETDAPFATSMMTSAILDEKVRACAEQVVQKFGAGATELNLTELAKAKEALKSGALPEGLDASVVTAENLSQLELFLLTGKGDLTVHRGVRINGMEYDEAYPLQGEATPARANELDEQLKACGYDRIYFKGPDERLYVALDVASTLRVAPGMRVQMGSSEEYRDSGEVLKVVDCNNTFKEATLEFWTDVSHNTVGRIRGKLGNNLDANVEATGAAATGGGFPAKEAIVAGGIAASAGATALVGIEALAPALGVVVGGLTLFNLVDYARTKHNMDKSPIYNAMGITLNRPDRIA